MRIFPYPVEEANLVPDGVIVSGLVGLSALVVVVVVSARQVLVVRIGQKS